MSQKENELSRRLQEAVNHLITSGIINQQQDLVDILSKTKFTVSRWLNGDATEKNIKEFLLHFRDIFNEDYLLKGEGFLLKGSEIKKHSEDDERLRLQTINYSVYKDLCEERSQLFARIVELERENATLQFKITMLERPSNTEIPPKEGKGAL